VVMGWEPPPQRRTQTWSAGSYDCMQISAFRRCGHRRAFANRELVAGFWLRDVKDRTRRSLGERTTFRI